MLRDRKVLFD